MLLKCYLSDTEIQVKGGRNPPMGIEWKGQSFLVLMNTRWGGRRSGCRRRRRRRRVGAADAIGATRIARPSFNNNGLCGWRPLRLQLRRAHSFSLRFLLHQTPPTLAPPLPPAPPSSSTSNSTRCHRILSSDGTLQASVKQTDIPCQSFHSIPMLL